MSKNDVTAYRRTAEEDQDAESHYVYFGRSLLIYKQLHTCAVRTLRGLKRHHAGVHMNPAFPSHIAYRRESLEAALYICIITAV